MDTRTIAYCQLNRVFGYDPLRGRRLVEAAGGPEEVFRLPRKEIRTIMGLEPPEGLDRAGLDKSAAELEKLGLDGCYFLGMDDNAYPQLLYECEDAPLGLYVKSKSTPEEIFCRDYYVAVVGTRDFSHYGREWCARLTSALTRTKERPTIVSGLALGTDITAHKAALEAGVPTIAVMATGIEKVYPHMHSYDADRIAASPGSALVTDYPPGTSPVANNFLRRNRIIAGLSNATILIESKIKGGGKLTANFAFSYNRDVYALPGKADDLRSQGCNQLISEKRADLIFSEKDLIEKTGLTPVWSAPQVEASLESVFSAHLPEDDINTMEQIIKIIRSNRGISQEDISRKTGMPIGQVSALLALLQAEGIIHMDLLGKCSIQSKN